MGLGGNLMWTSLAREIYERENKKVVFVSKNGIMKDTVFLNNPYISFNIKEKNIKQLNLKFKFVPEWISENKWNTSQHAIISRCNYFKITNPKVKCNLFFSKKEEEKIHSVVRELPEKFLLIEPYAKKTWTPNKQYPLEKWQKIVDKIKEIIPVVQCSLPGQKILNGVTDVSKKINSFREACLLAKYSKLFVSTEGGLMHGCNAVGTKCVIIFCPMFDPMYTKYDNVVDIWVRDENHFNCFHPKKCMKCLELMEKHDENIVIETIKKELIDERPYYSGSPALDF